MRPAQTDLTGGQPSARARCLLNAKQPASLDERRSALTRFIPRLTSSRKETCGQSPHLSPTAMYPFRFIGSQLLDGQIEQTFQTFQAGLGRRITASQCECCQDFVSILSGHGLLGFASTRPRPTWLAGTSPVVPDRPNTKARRFAGAISRCQPPTFHLCQK